MLCQSLVYSKVTQLYTYRHSFFFLYSFPLWFTGLDSETEKMPLVEKLVKSK